MRLFEIEFTQPREYDAREPEMNGFVKFHFEEIGALTNKIPNLLFPVFLGFLLFGNLFAQTKVFTEANCFKASSEKIFDCEHWSFSMGEKKFEIENGGRGKLTIPEKTSQVFSVSINNADYIDRVIYFAEIGEDLLLIGELSFSDAGGGFIARLDAKSLKTKWSSVIPAFNIASGLIEDNSAYIAGIGFIAKINLNSGKYIWKHDDLYRKYDENGAFNVFLTPRTKGELVIFEEEDSLNRGFDHQIHVNKSSGKIVNVILK